MSAPPGTPADAAAADAALLGRLRAGEDGAYEELVREHGGRLLRLARRLLGSEDEARDAVQDAFLSAFRALPRFQGDARLGTWLHRIVVNAALMRLRTRRRRPEESIEPLLPAFQADGHHAETFAAWREAPDERVLRAETRALVRHQIESLPDSARAVLVLRDIEGYDTAETARLLGITPGAVKIRLHRARQALRTRLAPYWERGER